MRLTWIRLRRRLCACCSQACSPALRDPAGALLCAIPSIPSIPSVPSRGAVLASSASLAV
jgi:hypothetical protein